jgi:hypothetical protein
MTYTVATMEVTQPTYDEIKDKLLAAGYQHAIDSGGMLDMTHIGLVLIEVPVPGKQVGTIGKDEQG